MGEKYEKTGAESVVITDVTGGHIIYYEAGVLTAIANPSEAQAADIVLNHVIVAYIYWNSVDAEAHNIQDERHGISMSPATHLYLHRTRGAQYLSGLAVGDIVIGNGSLDTHAQFSISSGEVADEDITHDLSAVLSTAGLKYFYRNGPGGNWSQGTNTGYSFPVGATPLPQYNYEVGGIWSLAEVSSGNYMLLHVFANGDIDGEPVVFIGNTEYSTVAAATVGTEGEIGTILSNLPTPEYVPIATVIIEGKTAFTNTTQARVVQNSLGEDYADWRTTELKAGTVATSHQSLTNLDLANTGVTYGHIDDQAQTIYGEKDFVDTVGFNTVFDNGNSGAADTIDWGSGNLQKSTLTDNCTYTFTAPANPSRLTLQVFGGATYSVTWPVSVKWVGGTAPTLAGTEMITFVYDGTDYYGVASTNFS
jgi:hypothetical protein